MASAQGQHVNAYSTTTATSSELSQAIEPDNATSTSRPWRAASWLPAAFLLLQLGVFAIAPRQLGIGYAYVVMALAPLLTAGACAWRARSERPTTCGRN